MPSPPGCKPPADHVRVGRTSDAPLAISSGASRAAHPRCALHLSLTVGRVLDAPLFVTRGASQTAPRVPCSSSRRKPGSIGERSQMDPGLRRDDVVLLFVRSWHPTDTSNDSILREASKKKVETHLDATYAGSACARRRRSVRLQQAVFCAQQPSARRPRRGRGSGVRPAAAHVVMRASRRRRHGAFPGGRLLVRNAKCLLRHLERESNPRLSN